MKAAESSFVDMRYPRGFFRASKPGAADSESIVAVRGSDPKRAGFQAGKNVEGVKRLMVDGKRIKGHYPRPTGVLRRNLNMNLQFLFD
ncbi:hypothetical protein FA15DRAFT_707543 [Coprinopsis marcescibilis]|uniref:Uncharacterized protein n=1 Tax=Coprinopsis marcescibilis TaxID=230819 RepID=A0A5C3KM50_COPMA|nr:hypothetical protein FA15DRAFT_707543 [Coprinopsis marcescibilis]